MASFSEAVVTAAVRAQYNGVDALGALTYNLLDWDPFSFESGTGAGKVDLLHVSSRTLAASATENLDLTGTSIQDPFNTNLAFANIKAILIRAAVGNTNNVIIGGAGANAFVGPFGAATETHIIRPNGRFLVYEPGAGWTVTPGTGDLFKILNSGGGTSVSFDVVLLGASA